MTDTDLGVCAICGETAQFTDAAPGANPVSYCSKDLPAHMQTAAAAGQMPLSGDAVTVAELRAEASDLEIVGRSSMVKDALVDAVSTAAAEQLEVAPSEPTEMTDAPTSDEALPETTPEPKKATKGARKR